jgi:cellulose biosynthesis protein BcsQ
MGQIITFYSYKGGVGRSMALANVGVILAQWGYKVLLIDFDLEAPGLEKFFSSLLDTKILLQRKGIVDFLEEYDRENFLHLSDNWKEQTTNIPLPSTGGQLQIWSAGRRDNKYFKKVRRLDFQDLYATKNGGVFIEELREELKKSYDFVLVDSRTGLTEIGGLSTVQLPDQIVLLFTATDQSFEGAIDIVERAAAARQKLPFQRAHVPIIPIPSRLDAQAEFRLSQRWLDRFARDLEEIFSNWFPRTLNPRALLDIMKLPHVSFFSYGESLPVLEHGNTDPGGLGQAYENLAALLARKLADVESLVNNRAEYIRKASRKLAERNVRESEAKIFISYSHTDRDWLERLQIHLKPLIRSRALSTWSDTQIGKGETWKEKISEAISESRVAVLLVSADYLATDFISENELPKILNASENQGLRVFWIAVRPSVFQDTEIGRFQAINDPSKPLSLLDREEQEKALVEIVNKIADISGRSY